MTIALKQFHQLGIRVIQVLVVADHGAVLGHDVAEFAPQHERVFGTVIFYQTRVDLFLSLPFRIEHVPGGMPASLDHAVRVVDSVGAGDESRVYT